jgi:hypothetical protein
MFPLIFVQERAHAGMPTQGQCRTNATEKSVMMKNSKLHMHGDPPDAHEETRACKGSQQK